MSHVTLSKTETALLVAAASAGGLLVIPDTTKPASRTRVIRRFKREALIVSGETGHHLTPAGYRAVGLSAPRRAKSENAAAKGPTEQLTPSTTTSVPPATKQTLVLELLGREEGASVPELIAATGWLPHTTRAALSRLRSAGRVLAKGARDDGTTAYRIEVVEVQA